MLTHLAILLPQSWILLRLLHRLLLHYYWLLDHHRFLNYHLDLFLDNHLLLDDHFHRFLDHDLPDNLSRLVLSNEPLSLPRPFLYLSLQLPKCLLSLLEFVQLEQEDLLLLLLLLLQR